MPELLLIEEVQILVERDEQTAILAVAEQGPSGPPGATGPQGPTGPDFAADQVPDLTLFFENGLI